MKILILMSDNREQFGEDYNSLTAKINSSYAKKWNYDFLYNKVDECLSPKNEKRHPAWSKLLSTKKAIKENKYDIIVYIDSDCIFSNQNISIEEYLKTVKNIDDKNIENKSIIFLNDIPWSNRLPCSGFFIVNTKEVNIFEDWFNSDFPHYNLNHSWEQYALYNNILPKWSEEIEIINDVMFLEKKGQFLRHIGTHESQNRIPYFKKYIQENFIV